MLYSAELIPTPARIQASSQQSHFVGQQNTNAIGLCALMFIGVYSMIVDYTCTGAMNYKRSDTGRPRRKRPMSHTHTFKDMLQKFLLIAYAEMLASVLIVTPIFQIQACGNLLHYFAYYISQQLLAFFSYDIRLFRSSRNFRKTR